MRTVTSAPPEPLLRAPDRFFIDGSWVSADGDEHLNVVDSSTEETFVNVALANEADIGRAVAAARKAFDEGPWPSIKPAERSRLLRRIGEGLQRRGSELASAQSTQMGIVDRFAQGMVAQRIAYFGDWADVGDRFDWIERHATRSGSPVGLLVREPVGVTGVIVPWNGPMIMLANKVAPALLAGCPVVIKASPEAPYEALVFAEVVEEVGLPPGVVNVVTADREPSESLVRDPRVDKISFTGSTAVGRRIASLCADRLARVTLELGGKSAAVILDDFDVDEAAGRIASLATLMTGQACASLTRIIVSRSRHDDLVAALVERFDKVRVGSARDPEVDMGPLVSQRQLDRVLGYVDAAVAGGASLACGGLRPKGLDRGFFIEPTIFADVDRDAPIAREEVFGPVLSVIAAADEDEAVTIANDTEFGLNNSVFTNDIDRAYAVARQLRSGTVGHNMFRADFGIAFGGFKQSGIGREGLAEGLYEYLESKTVLLEAEPNIDEPVGSPRIVREARGTSTSPGRGSSGMPG